MAERVARDHADVMWWCPALPPSPRDATKLILQGTTTWPRETMAVIGSSLGGFYARWFGLQTGCRAVLLNPAPHPARDLSAHIGVQASWHNPDEPFFFQPEYVDELRALEGDIARPAPMRPSSPDHLFAVVAKGDEVLDWREMTAFCAGGRVRLLDGGDHALSDFDDHIDAVLQAIGLG